MAETTINSGSKPKALCNVAACMMETMSCFIAVPFQPTLICKAVCGPILMMAQPAHGLLLACKGWHFISLNSKPLAM